MRIFLWSFYKFCIIKLKWPLLNQLKEFIEETFFIYYYYMILYKLLPVSDQILKHNHKMSDLAGNKISKN